MGLALGWIPTLLLVFGARWISGEPLIAQARTPIKVTRLFTGPDGKTWVEFPLGGDIKGVAGTSDTSWSGFEGDSTAK